MSAGSQHCDAKRSGKSKDTGEIRAPREIDASTDARRRARVQLPSLRHSEEEEWDAAFVTRDATAVAAALRHAMNEVTKQSPREENTLHPHYCGSLTT